MSTGLEAKVDELWQRRDELVEATTGDLEPIRDAVGLLDAGEARVGEGAMLGAGVLLNPSIPVIDAETGAEVARGVVPPWCLVVNATRPRTFPGGTFGLACALIIKRFTPGERHDKAIVERGPARPRRPALTQAQL